MIQLKKQIHAAQMVKGRYDGNEASKAAIIDPIAMKAVSKEMVPMGFYGTPHSGFIMNRLRWHNSIMKSGRTRKEVQSLCL